MKDDGASYGSADVRYGGTLDVTIGEGALWTDETDTMEVCIEDNCDPTTKTFYENGSERRGSVKGAG